MSTFFQTLRGLFAMSPLDAQERDAAYLAHATDLYDLERRMRQIDSGRHNLYAIGSYGIFMR
jgi:hypothetical protein